MNWLLSYLVNQLLMNWFSSAFPRISPCKWPQYIHVWKTYLFEDINFQESCGSFSVIFPMFLPRFWWKKSHRWEKRRMEETEWPPGLGLSPMVQGRVRAESGQKRFSSESLWEPGQKPGLGSHSWEENRASTTLAHGGPWAGVMH